MKKRIISAFSVLCCMALLFDYCSDATRKQYIEESKALTVGASALTAINIEELEATVAAENTDVVATAVEEETEFCGYTNIGICTVSEGNLNVREEGVEGAHVVGKLPKNAACEILDSDGSWVHISSGKVTGYVSADYILDGEEGRALAHELATLVATSNTGGLNIRTEPNTDCKILDQMADGEEVEVIQELGEWVEVDMDGETGYVYAEYVTVGLSLTKAMTIEEVRFGAGISETRANLCMYATQFVGNPYVWGGTSLTRGADCSGFVLSIYAKWGISLPHSSRAQANCGRRVSTSELKPGDLIFYGSGKSIGHVAIYIGGGQICHASNKRDGIKISNMYYRTPICCTRLLD